MILMKSEKRPILTSHSANELHKKMQEISYETIDEIFETISVLATHGVDLAIFYIDSYKLLHEISIKLEELGYNTSVQDNSRLYVSWGSCGG